MKHQKSCGPHWGKLVHQLPRVVTFAYDLCLGRMIAHWKGIEEELHFRGLNKILWKYLRFLIEKKSSFGPSKWPQKFMNRKTAKNSKLPKKCFELVGKGGWPPRSSWINPPHLGRNGIHFVECPH
jgi:hypothetical protein